MFHVPGTGQKFFGCCPISSEFSTPDLITLVITDQTSYFNIITDYIIIDIFWYICQEYFDNLVTW